jgi:nucleotide-binding universal stress UspA family protein
MPERPIVVGVDTRRSPRPNPRRADAVLARSLSADHDSTVAAALAADPHDRSHCGETTMTTPASPPIRRTTRRLNGLVVAGTTVPTWVRLWCDRSRRSVAARPADAVATASAAGDSVLIPRTDPPAAHRPRVAVALRDLPDDASALADALNAATHLGGGLTVLHGVPLSFGERTVGLTDALRHGRDLLDQARALAAGAGTGTAVEVKLIRAWPHEIVGERLDADLLVLGGPRTGSVGRVGLVTACAIEHAPCAVLLAPRPRQPMAEPAAGPVLRRPPAAPAIPGRP